MKLSSLTIKNFGCFDETGCTVNIDDIVVLIGQNNTGKSTVLDAYEAFASMGEKLPLSAFRDEDIKNIISIEGTFIDITEQDTETMGAACVYKDTETGENTIKVKFEWSKDGEDGEKWTFNASKGAFEKGGAGGWNTLLQSRIPVPLRIKPTDTPEKLEAIVIDILISTIKTKLKQDSSKVQPLIEQINKLTEQFAEEIKGEIDSACGSIVKKLVDVFPDYAIQFIPEGKLEPEKILGAGSHVRIKGKDRAALPLRNQGSGLQRTFLWAAISALAENGRLKHGRKALAPEKPRILLMDEPEAFLHPPMVRAAREALYNLSAIENWQVMASTHSSVFIDVSKPHATIIRIEKDKHFFTKVVSTDKLDFTADQRERLAMIRACNPVINEFFFADSVVLVEGDTEHLVFSQLLKEEGKEKAYHIVNCLGKGNIQLFAKILNHFQVKYVAIHDSDSPKAQREKKWIKNSSWTINENIMTEASQSKKGSYCIAQILDFEGYYFNEYFSSDKPFKAFTIIKSSGFSTDKRYEALRHFVTNLESGSHPNKYGTMEELGKKVEAWVNTSNPQPKERWELN